MAPTWDPRALLDIYPHEADFTCVGTTQRAARCRNSFIQHAYLREATQILDEFPEIEEFSRSQANLFPILQRLAWLTLCPRWHQSKKPQGDQVARKWLRLILNEYVRPSTPHQSTRQISAWERHSFSGNAANDQLQRTSHPSQSPASRARERWASQSGGSQLPSPPATPDSSSAVSRTFEWAPQSFGSIVSPPNTPGSGSSTSRSDDQWPPRSTRSVFASPPATPVNRVLGFDSATPQERRRPSVRAPVSSTTPSPLHSPVATPASSSLASHASEQRSLQSGRSSIALSPASLSGRVPDHGPATRRERGGSSINPSSSTTQSTPSPSAPAAPHSVVVERPTTTPLNRIPPSIITSTRSNQSSRPSIVTTASTSPQTPTPTIQINLNISLPAQGRRESRHRLASSSSYNSIQSLAEALNPSHTQSADRRTSTASATTHNLSIINPTTASLDAILSRLELYHSRVTAPRPRSSSSTTSYFTSVNHPSDSRSLSIRSDPDFSPIEALDLSAFAFPHSPALPPHRTGTLSISSESRSGSPLHTPSSTGFSTPVPLSPTSHPSRVQEVSASGIHRKPLTDPCYVCYEPIDGVDDATWCQGSCGQNIHVDCFEYWRVQQEGDEVTVCCGMCRAPWV